ncbi:2-dehydropantoate 2-reductase [Dactylosporangium sp. AC04546]|uniref:2-dehydropantoate 2-reductase n=1 Tax=Dactylosporangium sp. AC04546 TaxID=2862460 RepID=UPI001EDE9270|nr:2-dehydropantoate 2-reductase [Dactylosporangium sp. AC04546]WVK79747.1 2-dehydropantoate 2-reductase [Dactylosporangium sp. AC04546]
MTRVAVVGAGAVGGVIGVRLAAAGHETSVLARGATLAAIRAGGWRLHTKDGTIVADKVTASDDPAVLGPQDVVFLTVKAHALPGLAPGLAPLLGPDTVVVPALNGVPWWFFDGLGGSYDGLRLRAVDPDGSVAGALGTHHILGCVVHLSANVPAPGEVRLTAGDGLILGEPGGGDSERLRRTAALLDGFTVTRSNRIQRDIWYKLWGNMTVNPISALTGATADKILDDELVNGFAHAVMLEAAAIGARVGCPIEQSPADRNAVTRRLGAFKTSMLQDAEAGRPIELDAMLTAVREIAVAVGIPTPSLDALLGVTRLAARERGLYPLP